jgi:transposase
LASATRRHRSQEFIKFLDHANVTIPKEPGVAVHIVLDNYATHKTSAAKRWFPRHPEYHPHFTPTSGSWLNQAERFFAAITERRIRRGVFTSVPQLERAIADYLAEHNQNPRPFAWTATADSILERLKRVCERTSDSGH